MYKSVKEVYDKNAIIGFLIMLHGFIGQRRSLFTTIELVYTVKKSFSEVITHCVTMRNNTEAQDEQNMNKWDK